MVLLSAEVDFWETVDILVYALASDDLASLLSSVTVVN